MSFSKWRHFFSAHRPKDPAMFVLMYVPNPSTRVVVGRLVFDGEVWSFEYDDEYRHRSDLRPIEGFEDRYRVYRSPMLFPFFAIRVPDPKRKDVQRKLEADHISDPEVSDMLRLFGRRVASSPGFELQAG